MRQDFFPKENLHKPLPVDSETVWQLEIGGNDELLQRLRTNVGEQALALLQGENEQTVVVSDPLLSAEIRLQARREKSCVELDLENAEAMLSGIREVLGNVRAKEQFERLAKLREAFVSRFGENVVTLLFGAQTPGASSRIPKTILREAYFLAGADLRDTAAYLPPTMAAELRQIERELSRLDTGEPGEVSAAITRNQFRDVALSSRRNKLHELARESERWGGTFLKPDPADAAHDDVLQKEDVALELDEMARSSGLFYEPETPDAQIWTKELNVDWQTHLNSCGTQSPDVIVRRFLAAHAGSLYAIRAMHAYCAQLPAAKKELIFWVCQRRRCPFIQELLTYNRDRFPLSLSEERDLMDALSDEDMRSMCSAKGDLVFSTVFHAVSPANKLYFLERVRPFFLAADENDRHYMSESFTVMLRPDFEPAVLDALCEFCLESLQLRPRSLMQFLYERGRYIPARHREEVLRRLFACGEQGKEEIRGMLGQSKYFGLTEADIVRCRQYVADA